MEGEDPEELVLCIDEKWGPIKAPPKSVLSWGEE